MSEPSNRAVYLLDISFFIFRAYHAIPQLNTSEGTPTNAVHGVSTMLERLLRTEKVRYLAACFDTARATFRRDIYPEYKANRDEPEDDLRAQFPLVRRLVAAMNIPCLQAPGYEADDILATLARRYAAEGRDVVIVTGDKDLMQCVTDRISLYDPVKGRRVRHAEVEEKFGVPPEAVADVLGLMGDASDNIPGVRGVGPKTASALIAHFGSLEAMLENTAEIENVTVRGAASVRKRIEGGVEEARLCHRLALVEDQVPVDIAVEDLEICSLVSGDLEELAGELEMTRLVPRLEALAEQSGLVRPKPEGNSEARGSPRRAKTASSGKQQTLEPKSPASVEPEGDYRELAGLRPALVLTGGETGSPVLTLEAGGTRAVIVGEGAIKEALLGLSESGTSLLGHDLKALTRNYGADPGLHGLDLGVASYLVDPSAGDHGMVDLAKRFLDEEAVTGDTPEARDGSLRQVSRLGEILEKELDRRSQTNLYRDMELPLIKILAAIEAKGMLLEVDALEETSEELGERMSVLVGRVYEAAGCEFNILSPVQLRELLFTKLGLPTKGIKKTKTGPSTDSDSLNALAPLHPLPGLVLEYRALAKLKSTYVDALPRLVDADHRIHTTLNQTVTATGRLSSKDPNLQNIPVRTEDGVRIRAAFVAPDGKRLISADYNQIELRVLAHLSGDENLISAFEQGMDIHTATSAELFEVDPKSVSAAMRREAKVVNYGIVYGMGPVRLSRELGISRSKAADYIKRYFERFSGVQGFYDRMLDQARAEGFVSTMFGRRRYLPDILSSHGGHRQAAERVATNTPIQGSAADIIKRAMVSLAAALRQSDLDAELVLQIHDELLLECPQSEVEKASELTVRAMEGAAELVVAIVVDVGSARSWAEAH